jgi:hypothetical protein
LEVEFFFYVECAIRTGNKVIVNIYFDGFVSYFEKFGERRGAFEVIGVKESWVYFARERFFDEYRVGVNTSREIDSSEN